ncbi:hypothetical protein GGQ84_000721 [Desulfitispora alkaliphila]|uniref:hypothetical protein n=1 Tax=Desulfitispora alkaliphila TaxID=622674 RepID=UPI003D225E48
MKRLVVLILSISIATLLFTGCGSQDDNSNDVNQNGNADNAAVEATGTEPVELASSEFSGKTAALGDSVGAMKIITVAVISEEPEYQAVIKFEGATTLSGTYKHYEDYETAGNQVIFTVDETSKKYLPQLEDIEEIDQVSLKFGFTDNYAAAEAFGAPGSEGSATIVIDRYQINHAPDFWNTADLVEVVEKD